MPPGGHGDLKPSGGLGLGLLLDEGGSPSVWRVKGPDFSWERVLARAPPRWCPPRERGGPGCGGARSGAPARTAPESGPSRYVGRWGRRCLRCAFHRTAPTWPSSVETSGSGGTPSSWCLSSAGRSGRCSGIGAWAPAGRPGRPGVAARPAVGCPGVGEEPPREAGSNVATEAAGRNRPPASPLRRTAPPLMAGRGPGSRSHGGTPGPRPAPHPTGRGRATRSRPAPAPSRAFAGRLRWRDAALR